MATMVSRHCRQCKSPFEARLSDVKRGWGKFCSKSCKAKEQEERTGQYAEYLNGSTPKKKTRKNKKKFNKKTSSGVFDLSTALDRKIYQMENPINVEPLDPWDYDGPFPC